MEDESRYNHEEPNAFDKMGELFMGLLLLCGLIFANFCGSLLYHYTFDDTQSCNCECCAEETYDFSEYYDFEE